MIQETITHTITTNSVRISLNRNEFAQANFTQLSGQIYADVFYIGTSDQVSDESNRLIGFTKTLTPVDGVFEPGALVRITLTPDLSAFDLAIGNNQLVINDFIPTGMRFARFEQMHRTSGFGWHLVSRQGQRLQFNAIGGWRTATGSYLTLDPIVYYVRCVTPGEYVVESAHISSAIADTWGASERSTVIIEP